MEKLLVSIIKRIVKEQNLDVGVVRNLLGAIPDDFDEQEVIRPCEWGIYFLPINELVSPNDMVSRLTAQDLQRASIIKGINGTLHFIGERPGTYLISTVVSLPTATGIPIQVSADGRQIGIFLDESLIKRSVNSAKTTLNLPAGDTPINIVLTGYSSASITISLPSDIRTGYVTFIPPIPSWRSPIPIETNYVDPKTGQTGNALFWDNQRNVAGWGVYRISSVGLGTFTQCSVIDDAFYYLTLSGAANIVGAGAVLHVNSGILGTTDKVSLRSTGEQDIIVRLTDYQPVVAISNQTAYEYRATHLADVIKTNEQETFSYVDGAVQVGQVYSYALDSFSKVDHSIRSDKSVIKTITAGDTTPPGAISIIEFNVINGIAYVRYTTPSDTDYSGVHVYYNNVSSGTVDGLITDAGLPSTADALQFIVVNSGTYYFRSFDIVGNEQTIASGVSYNWTGDQTTLGSNIPPTVSIRLLSSAETQSDGYDPLLFARFELDAIDPDSSGSLSVDYRTRDNAPGNWNNVSSLPTKVNVARKARDNWLQARAYDGEDYSDVLTVVADYDTLPEISSLSGRVDINSNTGYINGAVDDDTQSLRWQLRENVPNGTLVDSGVELNLGSSGNKVFSISFDVPDGSRRYFEAYPYSEDNLGGDAGISAQYVLEIPPRTRATVTERNTGGAVKRNEALVSLSASPSNATTYIKAFPVSYGTVTSAGSTTLVDTSKINVWNDDQFNTGYEVYIYSGTGYGQSRDITDTVASTGTITVSPSWSVTPNTTSKYKIKETYYTYTNPVVIQRDSTEDITVNFYSELTLTTGVYLTEEEQSIILDNDTVPEIGSGSAIETDSKVITISIFSIDEDAKNWELYGRKDAWPTKTGTQFADLSTTYLRARKSTEDSSLTFSVANGEWRFIIRPFDSFSNPGPKIYLTTPITDSSRISGDPAIIDYGVEAHDYDISTNQTYNRVFWYTNTDAEKPGGGNGTATIKVFAYRSDYGPDSETEITDPTTRYIWQDSEDGASEYTNVNDTENTKSAYGSLIHIVDRRVGPPDGVWMTWYYRIELYDNAVLMSTHETELSDWYGPFLA